MNQRSTRKGSRAVRPTITALTAVAAVALGGVAAGQASPADQAKPTKPPKTPKIKHGVLTVEGTEADDQIAIRLEPGQPGTIQVDFGDVGTAEFSFARADVDAIDVEAGNGDDTVRVDESGGLFTDAIPTTFEGQNGDDTLLGGSGAETLDGGNGNDTIDGNRGNDTALIGGGGNDTFVWDPGDGSDTNEGQGGTDTMRFNGSNAAEKIDLSANGNRLRLTRDVAAIVMDANDVEQVDLRTLGSADTVTVNDLAATDVRNVNVDLAATGGGGDGSTDRVVVNGTAGADTIHAAANGSALEVTGLAATVDVTGAEAATDAVAIDGLGGIDSINADGTSGPDTLGLATDATNVFATGLPAPVTPLNQQPGERFAVNGLGGDDVISGAGDPLDIVAVTIDGGDGNDTLAGTGGADTILGGNGNDTIDGNRGNDTALFGGDGNDTFVWDPGDGSDTNEGQGGTDTMRFNGSNAAEKIDLSANGNRLRLTRDVAAIVMDANDVEQVDLRTLGSADTVTVNDLAATDVRNVNVDLAATGGGGDGSADRVVVDGTAGNDTIHAAANGDALQVTGLAATVDVTGAETPTDAVGIDGLGGTDQIAVDGTDGPDTLGMTTDAISAFVTGLPAPVGPLNQEAGERLAVNGLAGDDNISGAGDPLDVVAVTIDGGTGNDTIAGTGGADLLIGGDGNDTIDGNRGNDTAFMGAGDDTFVWDPGDGSDTVEGQQDTDTMLFNGANIAENIALSANGGRLRFTRDIASIVMDTDDVEIVAFNALGGADTITVNDLTGTDVHEVRLDLAATGGGGDGSADRVLVNGTDSEDTIHVSGGSGSADVTGLAAAIGIRHAEPALDTLEVDARGGDDAFEAAGLAGTSLKLIAHGGEGADILVGSGGDDTLTGDAGDDVLIGGPGQDVLDGGPGNNVLIQD